MRRLHDYAAIAVALFLLTGCASIQIGPDATADEKARAAVSDAIDTVDMALTAARTYATIRAERLSDYKSKILPIADVTASSLGDAVRIGASGGRIDGPQLTMMASQRAIEIAAIVATWNVKAKKPAKAPPKAAGYTPPTWEDLQMKSDLLRARIAAER